MMMRKPVENVVESLEFKDANIIVDFVATSFASSVLTS